jgi:hypothetical protein
MYSNMSDGEIVETLYDQYSKYEVVKHSTTFGGPKFYLRKNGEAWKGSFASLSAAVDAARKEGAK